MLKLFIIVFFPLNILMANDYISQRQDSMQKFNKLMRSANQMIKNSEINEDLSQIYTDIENIMIEYPTLFPDDSFKGKLKLVKILFQTERSLMKFLSKQQKLLS